MEETTTINQDFKDLIGYQIRRWTWCQSCICYKHPSLSFVCNRLPEADDCGREHHSLNVPLPVAACVRSHPARLPSPFPRCSCAVSNGPPLQWAGWPHQARAATGGTFREQCLSYWVQTFVMSNIWLCYRSRNQIFNFMVLFVLISQTVLQLLHWFDLCFAAWYFYFISALCLCDDVLLQ